MPSNGRRCEGDLRTGADCELKKDGSGEKCTLNSACDKCREWRCKTHCRCGRQGTATGRSAARSRSRPQAKAKAKPQARPAQPQEVVALRPRGRPASLATDVFDDGSWRARLLEDISGASSVLVASYTYDDPDFQAAFLKRLRGRAGFSLELMVDLQTFEARTCRHQRPRLLELQRPLRWGLGISILVELPARSEGIQAEAPKCMLLGGLICCPKTHEARCEGLPLQGPGRARGVRRECALGQHAHEGRCAGWACCLQWQCQLDQERIVFFKLDRLVAGRALVKRFIAMSPRFEKAG